MTEFPVQRVDCEHCEGGGRVGVIARGPRLFAAIVDRPTRMTPARLRAVLAGYRGTDAGFATQLIRGLAASVEAVECPDCGGSGCVMTVQQTALRKSDGGKGHAMSKSS